MDLEDLSGVLGDNELTNHDDDPYKDEHKVGVNSFEDVKLVMNLSGANHVEDLEQHECVENEGQVTGRTILFSNLLVEIGAIPVLKSSWEDKVTLSAVGSKVIISPLSLRLDDGELTSEEEEEENDALPDGHTEDVLDHLAGYNVVLSVLGHSFQKVHLGQFSRES